MNGKHDDEKAEGYKPMVLMCYGGQGDYRTAHSEPIKVPNHIWTAYENGETEAGEEFSMGDYLRGEGELADDEAYEFMTPDEAREHAADIVAAAYAAERPDMGVPPDSRLTASVEIWGAEICETLHASIIYEALNGKRVRSDEIQKKLDYWVSLIKTILAPFDGEYNVNRFGSHIVVDRAKKILGAAAGTRLLVVGLK